MAENSRVGAKQQSLTHSLPKYKDMMPCSTKHPICYCQLY